MTDFVETCTEEKTEDIIAEESDNREIFDWRKEK